MTSSGREIFLAARASFHPSVLHHLETDCLDTPNWSAISVSSMPDMYSDRPSCFFLSISAFVIKTFLLKELKTGAKLVIFRQ